MVLKSPTTSRDQENMKRVKEVIQELYRELGRSGVTLGRCLKLDPSIIQTIEEDYKGNQNQINYNILLKWVQVYGRKANLSVLRAALKKAERTDLAEKYCEGQPEEKKPGQTRKRKVQECQEENGPGSKKQKKNPGPKKVAHAKSQTEKEKPTQAQKRKAENLKKENGFCKRQKKNPGPPQSAPAKEVTRPNTSQEKRKDTISLKILREEQKGFPKPHPTTGKWFRGRFQAVADSNSCDIVIWGNQSREKMSLFKVGACVTLKGYRMDGNIITVVDTTAVDKCETKIRMTKDLKHQLKKEENKKLKTLEDIKKSGQPSLTKLRVCEVGECKGIRRTEDGKKILLRVLKVRNKKSNSKQKQEVVQYGTDSRRKLLTKGRTIILNVWYNEGRKQFETKGPFKMKICPKSKKKKSKKQKSKL